MKRIAVFILFMFLAFCLYGCSIDPNIPNGYTVKEEHFDKDGFQDYSDFRDILNGELGGSDTLKV